jgi:osmotically-inducible protein OsmY
MEELMTEVAVRKSRSYLPETQQEAAELAALIEKAIDHETDRGIRGLSVAIEDGGILLSGHCESFYHKQLAQHAAMAISGSERLVNGIEVS